MTQRRRWTRWTIPALVMLALVVTACGDGGTGPKNRQNTLRPKGEAAREIDNLFTPVFWIAVVIGVLVIGGTIFVAVRYRQRRGQEDRPKQIHGNTPLEIGWTMVPALILAVVAVPTVAVIFDLAEDPGPGALQVTAVGKQWWWQFDYPNPDGNGKVVTANEMHIPTGRDVEVTLKACDPSLPGGVDGSEGCNVIHSFWVPELAGKRDVIPGRANKLATINVDEPGVYLGQCAEYCGLSHANMRFRVIAQSPDDFEQWLEGQRDGPAVTLADAGDAGRLFQQKFQCTNCHTTEDSSLSVYGPNLTHLASRTTFASGYYELTRPRLVDWILNAPAMIPMESEDCRLGLGVPGVTCVGMPSFVEDTPPGQPVMTRQEAETIADYLLSLQ